MRAVKWFQNLLTLTPDNLGILRQKVGRSFGQIRIFVHPFFEHHNPSQFHQEDPKRFLALNPKIEAIERACFQLAGMKKAPPLIIFEEERHLIATQERLAPYVNGNRVYYVPTFIESGIPKIEPFGDPGSYPEAHDDLEYVWKQVLDPLRASGTRSLIIGGMLLEIHHEKDKNLKPRDIRAYRESRRRRGARYTAYDIDKCVAKVVKEMSRHFSEIQVSCLAHPQSYGDIRRIERGGSSTPIYPITAQRQQHVV